MAGPCAQSVLAQPMIDAMREPHAEVYILGTFRSGSLPDRLQARQSVMGVKHAWLVLWLRRSRSAFDHLLVFGDQLRADR